MRKLNGNFRDIFNGFSVALDIKKMFTGFVAICLTLILVVVIPILVAWLFVNPQIKDVSSFGELHRKAMSTLLAGDVWKVHLFFTIIGILVFLVWAYFGGVISRIAAVNLTKDEGLPLKNALSFANKKFISLISPFILVILGFLFFVLCNVIGGFVGLIPYAGELLVSIFLPLAVLSGFIMVFILIGFIFSKNLFLPTIAVESSDAFDAVSRSFQYIYAEPWHFFWYVIVAKVYGIITTAFVWFFGFLMLYLSLKAVKLGMGLKLLKIFGLTNLPQFAHVPISDVDFTYKIAAYIIMVWLVLIIGIMFSYVISYCYTASTIIYLLMRKKVDDIEMNEIYEEEIPQGGTPESEPKTDETPTSFPSSPSPATPPPSGAGETK
ncbi:MAG: hypothetical protein QME51_00560 [Planctomycetota bacterium]|nr:hypothetical protein [Planctomycetota bacterium]MDI6786851.1 hypothetical protein [Planctomycetota bacterium]